MSTKRDTTKVKLYMVVFSDGYKKPIMAETTESAREEAVADGKYQSDDIVKVTVEQNYYPNHFYVGDV
ncbi:hypothetical protein KAH37_02380 [bacterium]|nr:hypothetical protein [bacterium]